MLSASEYRKENEKLMIEYEIKVREWLCQNGKEEISKNIPFIRDGVTCPEVWFQEGNNFRPLFILKEASIGIDSIKALPDRLKVLGNPKYIEFAEYPFEDVRVGKSKTWIKIAKLAKALEEVHFGKDIIDYDKYDLSFKPGGEEYVGDIEAYLYDDNRKRTGNPIYRDIIDKIAVLDLKKVAAGKNTKSELSKETLNFTEHTEKFKDMIYHHIALMDPTVIICCGKDADKWLSDYLTEIKQRTDDIYWINNYHPRSRISNAIFFDECINQYRAYRNKH